MTRQKHSVVIGGSKGIGKCIVDRLRRDGHRLSVISLAKDHLSADDGIRHIAADITEPGQRDAALRRCQDIAPIDHVIFSQRYRGDGDSWEGELDTCVHATKHCIDALHPDMSRHGSIVVIGSILGEMLAAETSPGYHVAKAALTQLTRYYGLLLAERSIQVNCISPGTILKDESKAFYLENGPVKDLYDKISPLNRMGRAEEIANIVAFFCHPDSAIITGQTIVADGGLSMQWQESLSKQLVGLLPS